MKKILFILIVTLLTIKLFGQLDTTFWFAAPDIENNRQTPINLRISCAAVASTVTITQPANASFVPIVRNLVANGTQSVDLSTRVAYVEVQPANTILNYGLLIKATNPITVYYETGAPSNPELYSLKGRNSLGISFYIPAQTFFENSQNIGYTPAQRASFNIIATENSTTVTITPSDSITGHLPNISYDITLNKGQVYCALAQSPLVGRHLQGSKVTSDKPIAITINDNLLKSNLHADVAGDQLIPENVIGNEYIVVKGQLNNERVSILATQNNTNIYLDGNAAPITTKNTGETYEFQLTNPVVYIKTSAPVYVLHISGYQEEIGGAIIPCIICTGSNRVDFVRSSSEPFYLTILARTTSINSFLLNNSSAYIISGDFNVVPGTGGIWSYTQKAFDETIIPVGTARNVRLSNGDLFHMGIINGDVNTGCSYGFFSSFSYVNAGNDVSICYGTGSQLNASGGTTYSWSPTAGLSNPNIANPIATPTTTTTYTVTATKGDCIKTDDVTVYVYPQITPSISTQSVLCYNDANGQATITPSGGTSPYTYLWPSTAGSQTTATATGLAAGNYVVTITDSKGCSTANVLTNTVTITQPTQITATTSSTLAGCELSDGSATVTPSGGTPNYSYLWPVSAGNQTTATATGLPAGNYTVTVTDANNCKLTQTVSVDNVNKPSVTYSTNNVNCYGFSTGSFNLSITGGTPPYSFNWSNSSTNEDVSNLPMGLYYFTVTDAANCQATGSDSIRQKDSIKIISSATNILCNGLSTGSINLTTSGGTPNYTYNWSNSATTEDISNIPIGTYSCTVTDINGCTKTISSTINQPPLLSASISHTNLHCYNDFTGSATIEPSGGTGTYTYNWSPSGYTGGNTSIYSDLPIGTYTVTITDHNNCTKISSTTITQPTALTNTVDTTFAGCNKSDGTATLIPSGGTSGYSYLWSANANNQTTATATGLEADIYYYTITDVNLCTKTGSVAISNDDAPIINSTVVNNIKCYGDSTGSINVTISGGNGAYTYNWSLVTSSDTILISTSQDVNNLPIGTYIFIVTDSANCKSNSTTTIIQPPLLSTLNNITDILCHGLNTGSINLTSSGGTPNYTYNWSNSATTEDINNISAGVYNYTITDANNCKKNASITISEPDTLIANIIQQVHIKCYGDNTGSADLSVTGGVLPYTYSWSGPSGFVNNSQDINSIIAGTYIVTSTDANGCKDTAGVLIYQQPDLVVTPTITNPKCNGNNGTILITATGGTPEYTYHWFPSVANNTNMAEDLVAGTYEVTITDNNGCYKLYSTILTSPPTLLFDDTIYSNIINYMGHIYVAGIGGTPIYTYSWSSDNGQAIPSSTGVSQDINNLTNGIYTVTLTDAVGCTLIKSFKIDIPFIIPSVITPNEDGINDNFQIVGIEGYVDVSIEIYNRWGDILFVFNGTGITYGNPANRWNGEHNGKKLPVGSYVYIVKLGNEIEPITGVVSIVR